MTVDSRNQTIALAGLYQSIEVIHQLAWHGTTDSATYETCLHSIFEQNPDSYELVYGGLSNLRPGLWALRTILTRNHKGDTQLVEKTRYAVTLVYLERKLSRKPAFLEAIQTGIERAQRQLTHYEPTHENIVSGLADLYEETVSQLNPCIMVQGEQSHLTNTANASRIRAMLLAGIRAVVLWRQAGGTRIRLLTGRKRLLRHIDTMLAV